MIARMAGTWRTYRMAAIVAPVSASVGAVRGRTVRFHRAMTRMTPKNEKTFTRNAAPTPAAAISRPASAGPTALAMLNSMPFNADAAGKSSFPTNSGSTARQVGDSMASPAESAKVRARSSHGEIAPASVVTARITATASIHASVYRMSLRRSTMSPSAPAGSASRKNGAVDAVCVSAT